MQWPSGLQSVKRGILFLHTTIIPSFPFHKVFRYLSQAFPPLLQYQMHQIIFPAISYFSCRPVNQLSLFSYLPLVICFVLDELLCQKKKRKQNDFECPGFSSLTWRAAV